MECLVCKKSKYEIPLTKFHFQNSKFYICPEHLPILIHKPLEVSELLAGLKK